MNPEAILLGFGTVAVVCVLVICILLIRGSRDD